jgi:hypothetical protein
VQDFDGSLVGLVNQSDHSCATLVNLLSEHFPCFRDESHFERKRVKFYKRAQILAADLWAAFESEQYGEFHDIHKLTMFAGE